MELNAEVRGLPEEDQITESVREPGSKTTRRTEASPHGELHHLQTHTHTHTLPGLWWGYCVGLRWDHQMVTLREGPQQGASASGKNEIVFPSGWWRTWLQNLLGQDPQPVPELRGQQQHQPGLTDRFDVLQEPAEGPEGPWWHQPPPKVGC